MKNPPLTLGMHFISVIFACSPTKCHRHFRKLCTSIRKAMNATLFHYLSFPVQILSYWCNFLAYYNLITHHPSYIIILYNELRSSYNKYGLHSWWSIQLCISIIELLYTCNLSKFRRFI